MKTRILSLLLMFCMLGTMMPSPAQAEEDTEIADISVETLEEMPGLEENHFLLPEPENEEAPSDYYTEVPVEEESTSEKPAEELSEEPMPEETAEEQTFEEAAEATENETTVEEYTPEESTFEPLPEEPSEEPPLEIPSEEMSETELETASPDEFDDENAEEAKTGEVAEKIAEGPFEEWSVKEDTTESQILTSEEGVAAEEKSAQIAYVEAFTEFSLNTQEITAPGRIELIIAASNQVKDITRVFFRNKEVDYSILCSDVISAGGGFASNGEWIGKWRVIFDIGTADDEGTYVIQSIAYEDSQGNNVIVIGKGDADYEDETYVEERLPEALAETSFKVIQEKKEPTTTKPVPEIIALRTKATSVVAPNSLVIEAEGKTTWLYISVWFRNSKTGHEIGTKLRNNNGIWSNALDVGNDANRGEYIVSKVEMDAENGNIYTYYGAGSPEYGSAQSKLPQNLATVSFKVTKESEIPKFDTSDGSVINAKNGVKLYWCSADVATYRVLRKAAGEKSYSKIADTTKLTYLDKTAKSGTKYSYKIRGLDANGETTGTSAAESITFIAAPKISDVTNEKLGLKLTWGKVSGAVNYVVNRKNPGEDYWTILGYTTKSTYLDKTTETGKKYSYCVTCASKEGYAVSADSSAKSATFKAKTVSVQKNKTKVSGQFQQTEARKFLSLVNKIRTKKNVWYWNSDDSSKTVFNTSSGNQLGKLKYDYELEKVAMERARETALYWSHTRPNGQHFSTLTINGVSAEGENIACRNGYHPPLMQAEAAFRVWEEESSSYSGQGHRRTMLNPSYTTVACGCYVTETGETYWVAVFGTSPSGAKKTAANDGKDAALVSFSKDRVDADEYQLYRLDDVQITGVNAVKNGIKLEWEQVLCAKKYEVFRRPKGGKWKKIATVTGLGYTDTKVSFGKIYQYRIKPVNGKIVADYSETVTISYVKAPALAAPVVKKQSVTLKWKKVTGANMYRVFRKEPNDKSWVILNDVTSTQYVDKTAKKGKKFSYAVRCISKDGNRFESLMSAAKTITAK